MSDEKTDLVPIMVEWGRGGWAPTAPNAGGDVFLLPVRNYENGTQDVIMLDSGRRASLFHIVRALGQAAAPPPDPEALKQHDIYQYRENLERKLIGIVITHKDADHSGGFEALVAHAASFQLQKKKSLINDRNRAIEKALKKAQSRKKQCKINHKNATNHDDNQQLLASSTTTTFPESDKALLRRANNIISRTKTQPPAEFLDIDKATLRETCSDIMKDVKFIVAGLYEDKKVTKTGVKSVDETPKGEESKTQEADTDSSAAELEDLLRACLCELHGTTTNSDVISVSNEENDYQDVILKAQRTVFVESYGRVAISFPDQPTRVCFYPCDDDSAQNARACEVLADQKSPVKSVDETITASASPYSTPKKPSTRSEKPSAQPLASVESPDMRSLSLATSPQSTYVIPLLQSPLSPQSSSRHRFTDSNEYVTSPSTTVKQPDRSEANLSSIVTCYIGQYNNESFHYAFAGDSTEDVASEARKQLPPNDAVFRGLLSINSLKKEEIHGERQEHRTQRMTFFDKVWKHEQFDGDIVKFLQNQSFGFHQVDEKWDMLQLNHHGSIKNVPLYGELRSMSDEELKKALPIKLREHLQSLARGFFATSPGTNCHADPLVLQVITQIALNSPSRPGSPTVLENCRSVHLAYQSVRTADGTSPEEKTPGKKPTNETSLVKLIERTDFSDLKAVGVLRHYFHYFSLDPKAPTPCFAAPLTPYVELDPDATVVSKEVKRMIDLLRLGTMAQGTTNANASTVKVVRDSESELEDGAAGDYKLLGPDAGRYNHFLGCVQNFDATKDMRFVARLAQLRQLHVLLDPMLFLLKVSKHDLFNAKNQKNGVISLIRDVVLDFKRDVAEQPPCSKSAQQLPTCIVGCLNCALMSVEPTATFKESADLMKKRASAILAKAWVACGNFCSVLDELYNRSILNCLGDARVKCELARMLTLKNQRQFTSKRLECSFNVIGDFSLDEDISLKNLKQLRKLEKLIEMSHTITALTEGLLRNPPKFPINVVKTVQDACSAVGVEHKFPADKDRDPEAYIQTLCELWQKITDFFKTQLDIVGPETEPHYTVRILDNLSILSRLNNIDHALDERVKRWQDDSQAVDEIVTSVRVIIDTLLELDSKPHTTLEQDKIKSLYIKSLDDLVRLFNTRRAVELESTYNGLWNDAPNGPGQPLSQIPVVAEAYAALTPALVLEKLQQKFDPKTLIVRNFKKTKSSEATVVGNLSNLSSWCFATATSPFDTPPTKYRFTRSEKAPREIKTSSLSCVDQNATVTTRDMFADIQMLQSVDGDINDVSTGISSFTRSLEILDESKDVYTEINEKLGNMEPTDPQWLLSSNESMLPEEQLITLTEAIAALAPPLQPPGNYFEIKQQKSSAESIHIKEVVNAISALVISPEPLKFPTFSNSTRENNCLIDSILWLLCADNMEKPIRTLFRIVMMLCHLLELEQALRMYDITQSSAQTNYHMYELRMFELDGFMSVGSAAVFNKYVLCRTICFLEHGDDSPLSLFASYFSAAEGSTTPALLIKLADSHFAPLSCGTARPAEIAREMSTNFARSIKELNSECEVSQCIADLLQVFLNAMATRAPNYDGRESVEGMRSASKAIARATLTPLQKAQKELPLLEERVHTAFSDIEYSLKAVENVLNAAYKELEYYAGSE